MDNLIPAVPTRIAQLAAAFSQPEPIRRGSLYERRMKCGQAACACQDDPQAAHGPYFTLTQKVRGKTRSRYIPPQQAPLVRQQIESGRQFRERVEAYWDACERWARRGTVFTTSGKIDGACDIRSFTNKVSAPRRACWKPAAKWRSAPG